MESRRHSDVRVLNDETYDVKFDKGLGSDDFVKPGQSSNVSMGSLGMPGRRSSMSGGKRAGSGQSKNVSWHNDDF